MKNLFALLCALLLITGVQATNHASQNVTIADYSISPDVTNQAVFYSLQEADNGRSFNFYIYLDEGRHDLTWGKTYSFATDMNPYFCYWQADAVTAYSLSEATLTKTKGEGYAVNITAHVVDVEGEEFNLTYTEMPLILSGDTVKVAFDKPAQIESNSDGTWSIRATGDTLGGRVAYYSADSKSCAGNYAGDEMYLPSCYMDIFTGEYEYEVPVYKRVYAKDASVVATETDSRIDAHAMLVGENGVVYDLTMAFDKPEPQEQVTITSDSLVIDTWGYERFGTVQMSASDGKHKAIFWFAPEGLDEKMAGSYVVGENECGGWVLNLEAGTESSLYSGGFTVSCDEGSYAVEGTVLCKNNVEYVLHLSIAKPAPTREETIVFARIPMTIDETEGWGMYGESADHTKFISIISPSATVAGTYTENELTADYCFVVTDMSADGSSNQYFSLIEANLTVTFDAIDSIAHVSGTMFCVNTQDPNDRPLFKVDVTAAMDSPYFVDETEDFTADFATYEENDLMIEDTGSLLVEARNEQDAFIALQFMAAEGAGKLTAGTYPINNTENPQTALASRGMYAGYATYSIAGYANKDKQFTNIWFLVSGTVTVSESGAIQVDALNSNGRKVQCYLAQPTGVGNIRSGADSLRKVLRNGEMLIERNGKTYNVQGVMVRIDN